MKDFKIQPFIWIIILLVFTLIIASQNQYYFKYALGVVTGMVIKDGLVLAIPIGIFMFFSNKKYHWYQWLNVLAYSTIFSRLFFGFLNNL